MIFPVFQREKCINYFCMIPKQRKRRSIIQAMSDDVDDKDNEYDSKVFP